MPKPLGDPSRPLLAVFDESGWLLVVFPFGLTLCWSAGAPPWVTGASQPAAPLQLGTQSSHTASELPGIAAYRQRLVLTADLTIVSGKRVIFMEGLNRGDHFFTQLSIHPGSIIELVVVQNLDFNGHPVYRSSRGYCYENCIPRTRTHRR